MPQMHDDMRGACAEPKASLGAYEWDELKQIARAIAAASYHTEGLAIARVYNLVDDELRLTGDTKRVMLEDGTMASVRILGFRHDKLANGAGKAGISFEFADVPAAHRMNADRQNIGGWYKSEMRGWLNSAFFGMLPRDLRSNIVEVKKRTSYREWDGERGGAFHVAATFDKLWLLSMREVYGRMSGHRRDVPTYPDVYDAEGTQYQLYADNDVSVVDYGFCKKDEAYSWWGLRSPDAYDSRGFLLVLGDGDWDAYRANYDWGVSPGFCF